MKPKKRNSSLYLKKKSLLKSEFSFGQLQEKIAKKTQKKKKIFLGHIFITNYARFF